AEGGRARDPARIEGSARRRARLPPTSRRRRRCAGTAAARPPARGEPDPPRRASCAAAVHARAAATRARRRDAAPLTMPLPGPIRRVVHGARTLQALRRPPGVASQAELERIHDLVL